MRVAPIITLSADEQKTLEKLARSNTASVRLARRIELAIWNCISNGQCTPDLGGSLTTTEAGAAVRERLGEYYLSQVAYG